MEIFFNNFFTASVPKLRFKQINHKYLIINLIESNRFNLIICSRKTDNLKFSPQFENLVNISK